MHGDGKSMGVKFEFGEPPILEKCVFDLLGKKILGKSMPKLLLTHTLSFFTIPMEVGHSHVGEAC